MPQSSKHPTSFRQYEVRTNRVHGFKHAPAVLFKRRGFDQSKGRKVHYISFLSNIDFSKSGRRAVSGESADRQRATARAAKHQPNRRRRAETSGAKEPDSVTQ